MPALVCYILGPRSLTTKRVYIMTEKLNNVKSIWEFFGLVFPSDSRQTVEGSKYKYAKWRWTKNRDIFGPRSSTTKQDFSILERQICWILFRVGSYLVLLSLPPDVKGSKNIQNGGGQKTVTPEIPRIMTIKQAFSIFKL